MASSFNMLGHTKLSSIFQILTGWELRTLQPKYMPSNKLPSSRIQNPTPPFNQSASAWDPGLTRLHLQLPYAQLGLGHGGNGVVRRAHLGEDFIQPLQRPVKMNLNPARGACHILSMILCTPTLEHKFKDISCNSPETVCYIKSPT